MGDIHKQWFQLGVFLFCMVHSLTTEARERHCRPAKGLLISYRINMAT